MLNAFVLLGFLLVLPATGLAQEARTFGTAAKTYLSLTPWDFRPRDSSFTYQFNPGPPATISRTNPTGSGVMVAPLHLPSGANVTDVDIVLCDSSGGLFGKIQIWLCRQPRMTAGFCSGLFSPLGTTGCVDHNVPITAFPIQVDNNAETYWIEARLEVADPTVQLGSVRVGYVLQVSPPPGAPTFDDVPTDHPFFPFVEALVAAGVTSGCSATPPLFCPDNPVTRAQMAALLSKALGLHFAP
jgi:hypothetical protein